ncbi:MAG TPA: polymer-forming cytoskeletal protein [Thiotrichales bacterium]|nr:polymer-forming cytoskeletal protein [Thiotrichales bacterium]
MGGRSLVRGEAINAWLGEEVRLSGGVLHFAGCLRIDGRLSGVTLEGGVLVVGEQASVSGRLEVDELIVFGVVDAVARVRNVVRIAAGGLFRGEMQLLRPGLRVEEGGRFQARVSAAEPPKPTAPLPAADAGQGTAHPGSPAGP